MKRRIHGPNSTTLGVELNLGTELPAARHPGCRTTRLACSAAGCAARRRANPPAVAERPFAPFCVGLRPRRPFAAARFAIRALAATDPAAGFSIGTTGRGGRVAAPCPAPPSDAAASSTRSGLLPREETAACFLRLSFARLRRGGRSDSDRMAALAAAPSGPDAPRAETPSCTAAAVQAGPGAPRPGLAVGAVSQGNHLGATRIRITITKIAR